MSDINYCAPDTPTLDDFEDSELIDEIYHRGISDQFIPDEPSLYDCSDEQLIQELTSREINANNIEGDMEQIYQLMINNKPYEIELMALIYKHIGRIL